jgi:hypothetical protein
MLSPLRMLQERYHWNAVTTRDGFDDCGAQTIHVTGRIEWEK